MSSRGSKAKNGHVTTSEYKIDYIYPSGAKVLSGQTKQNHSLPDFSHTPNSVYIKNDNNGVFHEMRFYDENGKAFLEIAYHPEPKINNGDRQTPIWHYHELDTNLKHEDAHFLDERRDLIEKYKIYLTEVGYHD